MKKGFMLFTLLAAFSGFAQADDAAIQQTLAKMGIKSSDIQPAPVAGMKTVLTNSGVLYITDDGKHIIQGPMYDVSGTAPVNVTNKMLLKQLNALEKEMIVYKAPQEKHVITVFTDITCGYCHKLHEQMADYNALGITVRYLAFPRQGLDSDAHSTGLAQASGNVSVLFQDSRLLPWLSVMDNLTLGIEQQPHVHARAQHLLQEVGLGDKASVWPSTLSGGQKQRAALARSLLREPHVLLADEPFGALDALTRMRMQSLLLQLVERTHPTVILVTHDVDEALLLADRILVIQHGKIAQDHDVGLPQPRRPDHPRFMQLRTELLRSLGVETIAPALA
jgi:sulfonate transport system ATP-binding protein